MCLLAGEEAMQDEQPAESMSAFQSVSQSVSQSVLQKEVFKKVKTALLSITVEQMIVY